MSNHENPLSYRADFVKIVETLDMNKFGYHLLNWRLGENIRKDLEHSGRRSSPVSMLVHFEDYNFGLTPKSGKLAICGWARGNPHGVH